MNKYSDEMQMTLKDTLLMSLYALIISSFVLFLFNIFFLLSALFRVKLPNRFMEEEEEEEEKKIKID
jgi:hypothetical protein